jgi:hypothetical protein
MTVSLPLSILVFGFASWFGLYLIARDPRKPRLRYTGLGLLAYALLIALETLLRQGENSLSPILVRLQLPLLFLPGLCWFAAAVDLIPDDAPISAQWGRKITVLLPGLALMLVLTGLFAPTPIRYGDPLFIILAVLNLLLMLAAVYFVWQTYREQPSKRTLALLLVVAIFFGLSNALLLFPANLIPFDLILLSIGLDMLLLDMGIAALDAFDEGEALLPDVMRSFAGAALYAGLFGGLVAVGISPEVTPRVALLYSAVLLSITLAVFADPIQGLIDRLIFRSPELRQKRSQLRAVADALPRMDTGLDVLALDEAEFARLTRRALSHLGDLGKLASSPLVHLPAIESRLAERHAPDNTLERAAELKSLLAESITRLKPREKGDFGTSDEWRYYNVLYFPYVLGLKPYSLNGSADHLDPAARTVLAWFQTQVPERTLHNWQNAAARLIAQDLRERQTHS